MNDQLILKCDEVLNELRKFSEEIIFLGKPITDDRIQKLESELGFILPSDFKYILNRHNSFSLMGDEVFGLGEEFRGSSLDAIYHFEHYEVANQMYKEHFPFSPDGYGNHYCLDLSKLANNVCPVVFWQHDALYSNKDEVEVCNESFVTWIQEVLIEWTLNEYDYNGNKKGDQ